ncbi:MAG TPA: DNA methylase, partial [Alphaproteobacteria bacterium]|nr:DNA methylase [Alphaproteobacteria bacterium]
SPPYMPRHHKWNPLYGGDPKKAGYDTYLKRMQFIFSKIMPLMKQNARLVVQVDNLLHGKNFTPLVHDIANVLTRDFIQIDEVLVKWDDKKRDKPKPDYPFTQYLVFKKKA